MEKTGFGAYIDSAKLADYAASTAMLEASGGSVSGAQEAKGIHASLHAIDSAHDAIHRRYAKGGAMPAACEWLLDNRYLARREGATALSALRDEKELRRSGSGALITDLCRALVASGLGEVTAERCETFLRGYQTGRTLTQNELAIFPAALRAALLEALADLCTRMEKSDKATEFEAPVAAVFTSLRLIGSIDLAPVIDEVNAVEQALRRDPSGIYPHMDEESRALYRAEVTRLAKKRGFDERMLAEKILSLAEKSDGAGRHVGWWLFEKPVGEERKGAPAGSTSR